MIRSLDFNKVKAHLEVEYKARIIYKRDSVLMLFIDSILRVLTFGQMQTFMSGFVTTIGKTIYAPNDWEESLSSAITLRHEMVHLEQQRRMGTLLFSLTYLFWPLPAVLALGRRDLEAEAYEETMLGWAEDRGISILYSDDFRDRILKHFLGASYFWMFPFRKRMEAWYAKAVARVTVKLSQKHGT